MEGHGKGMELTPLFSVGADAHHLVATESMVAVVDNKTNIHFANPEDWAGGKRVQSFNEPVAYRYHKGHSSSRDGRQMLLYLEREKKTKYYRFDPKEGAYKAKCVLSWNEVMPEISAFSPDGKMMAAAGADGRVFVYSTLNGKLLAILPPRSDYISAIAFSPDSSLLSYSCFKKKVAVYDLNKHMILSGFINGEVVTCKTFLNKTTMMVYGDRSSRVTLYDTLNGKLIRELGKTNDWPLCIYVEPKDRYCLVADKRGSVHLMDMAGGQERREPLFRSNKVVVEIKSVGEKIYFLQEDGKVAMLDMGKEKAKLESAESSRDTARINRLLQENPLLRFDAQGVLAKMALEFRRRLDQAIFSIANGSFNQAREHMAPVLASTENRQTFETVIKQTTAIVSFWKLVKTGQFAKAYNQAESNRIIKESMLFGMLEQRFATSFGKALELLAKTPRDERGAKNALKLYKGLREKEPLIKALFESPAVFSKADKLIKAGNYATFGLLCAQFAVLKEAPFYQEYKRKMDEVKELFLSAIAEQEMPRARAAAKSIRTNFPPLAEEMEEQLFMLEIYDQFSQAVRNKKHGQAMELAEKHTFLIPTEEYRELNSIMSKRFDMALQCAIKLNFPMLDKLMRPFLSSPYARNKAMHYYKLFYIEQTMRMAPKLREPHWDNFIKNYIYRFGCDSELETLVKRFDRDALLQRHKDLEPVLGHKYSFAPNFYMECAVQNGKKS